jgi:class 3 adenylate cyclase
MTYKEFLKCLERRAGARGRAREALDRRLRAIESPAAILVTDYRNFSLFTELFGILHFLTLIASAMPLLNGVVRRHGGSVLKWEADSLFALFSTARAAIDAAVDMNRALERRNVGLPEAEQLRLCCGVGWGPLLQAGREAFGAQVNRAAKLGEDLAEEEQILATQEAAAAAGPGLAWSSRRIARFGAVKVPYRELNWE